MNNFNEIKLQGVVVHKFTTDKVAILTISVAGNDGNFDYPKVVFLGEDIENIKENYFEGDKVRVEGLIQSSRFNENIKNQTLLSIRGKEIRKYEGLIKESFPEDLKDLADAGSSGIEYDNKFRVSGNLVKVKKVSDNVVRLTVSALVDGKISYVILTDFVTNADEVVEELSGKTYLWAVGRVQTSKKDYEDGTKYFENYVVSGFCASES